MANAITHIYFGRQVINALSKEITDKYIVPNMDAFLFGTTGPDFLFALREIGDKNGRYCNVMQYSKAYEVFESMAKWIEEKGDYCELAHALGILCHFVLDFRVHPYVNYMQENYLGKDTPTEQQNGIHALIESSIDEYITTELMGYKDSNDYKVAKDLRLCKKSKNAIASLYTNAINPILGFDLSKFKVKLAIFMGQLFMSFTTDKKGKRREYFSKKEANSQSCKKVIRNLMRPPELYGKLDFLNFQKRPFRAVRNEEAMVDFTAIELLNDAVSDAVSLITKFLARLNEKKPLDAYDFRVNYEGVSCSLAEPLTNQAQG